MAQHEIPEISAKEAVILAVIEAKEKFGREIRDGYEERRGRGSIAYGTLYTVLDRMEKAGLIKGRDGEPNPELGGNRRRFYKIDIPGKRALEAHRQAIGWRGAEGAKLA